MGGEIGERGSGTHSDRFLVIFHGSEGILTAGAKEIIKNHPDPSSQTFKKPKNHPKRLPLEDAPFCLPSTAPLLDARTRGGRIPEELPPTVESKKKSAS